MLRIKRMDLFILQSFLPLFVMTFCICLFIVLMQFLWRYIDDLVGKGLGVDVISELFFYAALTMVPMALPLAILLASLMIFGNLGENFELTAMKASGISLLRTMAPLIILMVIIATGAFFFQNYARPVAQTKMYTLLYSVRQKSPELEIPEGVFYDQIPGYNLFVEAKDRDRGILYGMMIYDVSKGFENSSIILADSGKMSFTDDKTHLFLQLWSGESFENLKEAASGMKNVPYRRETFNTKEIMVPFDANFNRLDEQGMRSQYIGKNISELRATIDSVRHQVDSVGSSYAYGLRHTPHLDLVTYEFAPDTAGTLQRVPTPFAEAPEAVIDVDSVFRGSSSGIRLGYLQQALSKAQRSRQEYEYRAITMNEDLKTIRRHSIELMKKFTLSFACIIFFFIGAPLGAIIRKGGLGTPLVISVFLFIFYYIIDNKGYKMARDGKWPVWQGMWLSAAVLLPLGIFFTYKAVNDSTLFNPDAIRNFFSTLLGLRQKRTIELKEVVMEDVRPALAIERLTALEALCSEALAECPSRQGYTAYWLRGYDRPLLLGLREQQELIVERLSNSRSRKVIFKLREMPVLRVPWFIQPCTSPRLAWLFIVLFPIGIPMWLIGGRAQSLLRSDLRTTVTISSEIVKLIRDEQQ